LLQVSMLHACTCKDKRNKTTNKQRRKQGKNGEHAKNTLTKKAKQGETKQAKHIKGGNKHVIKKKKSVQGGQM